MRVARLETAEVCVRVERLDTDGQRVALARRLRRLAPPGGDAVEVVAEIIAVVRARGGRGGAAS